MRPLKVFTQEQIEEIKNLHLNSDLNIKEISLKLGVSYSRVSVLIKNLGLPKKTSKAKGVKLPSKRLVIDLVKVKELRDELYSFKQIASILGVNPNTLARCIREDITFIDTILPACERLGGKIPEILKVYSENKSITKTANYFKIDSKTISRILKSKGIEIKLGNHLKGRPQFLTHGKANHYLYSVYKGIKNRCFNIKSTSYKNYGARGITLYKEWSENFELFYEYVLNNLGERPKGYSLDRINNEGNYEPNNIRWASASEQSQNTRNTILSPEKAQQLKDAHISKRLPGELSVKQLAKEFGIDYSYAKKVSRGDKWND
jgi:AraC-like DNA-binding protein